MRTTLISTNKCNSLTVRKREIERDREKGITLRGPLAELLTKRLKCRAAQRVFIESVN